MTPYVLDPVAWQESWDRQQEGYLPDREERFTALLDTVAAAAETPGPVVLDLAGGTGSISLRVLRRFPYATTTLVDVDPVLLTIARESLDQRSTVVTADLRDPDWAAGLPRHDYDAVLTATALHWIDPERLTALYAEIRQVLRPGGVFVNVDRIPDDGLPELGARLGDVARGRRESRHTAGAALSWEAWWEHVAKDPVLGPLLADRRKVFAEHHGTEWNPPLSWHLDTLRAGGYREAGLVWRGGRDAAVAGVR